MRRAGNALAWMLMERGELRAGGEVRDKGIVGAAHVFEVSPDDVEFAEGLFQARGTNQRIDVLELEDALRNASDLPDGVPQTLTSKSRFEIISHMGACTRSRIGCPAARRGGKKRSGRCPGKSIRSRML